MPEDLAPFRHRPSRRLAGQVPPAPFQASRRRLERHSPPARQRTPRRARQPECHERRRRPGPHLRPARQPGRRSTAARLRARTDTGAWPPWARPPPPIARKTGRRPTTVRAQVKQVHKKLRVSNRGELVHPIAAAHTPAASLAGTDAPYTRRRPFRSATNARHPIMKRAPK